MILWFIALGLWGWVGLFAFVSLLTFLIEADYGTYATISVLVTLAVANFVFKVPVIKDIIADPARTATFILVYFLLGVIWGFIKWVFFVHKQLGGYKKFKAEFLKRNNATTLTPELAMKLKDSLMGSGIIRDAPLASEHKSDILRWMAFWPFSIIGTLLNDVVRNAWEHIYIFISDAYNAVSARIYRQVTADQALAKEYKDSLPEPAPNSKNWRS